MPRTDEQVIGVLAQIYSDRFGGKERQRFLITWGDLRAIYGFRKLFYSRFRQLAEGAYGKRFYLWDLGDGEHGHLIAVVRSGTVDRWRRVPKKILEAYLIPVDEDAEPIEDDSD